MKRKVLPLSLLFMSSFAMAQVGIGTRTPDKSAMLEVLAPIDDLKGVLIPRIPLTTLTDNSFVNNGNVTNSLLVFNTTENKELKPGYYYWFKNSWVRIITDQDDIYSNVFKNEELAVNDTNQTLYLKDSNQNIVSVPLKDINILTDLVNQGSGKYIYTAEDGSQTTIDVVGDVINNFDEIIENKEVQETLNQYFNNSLPLGNVTYVEENGVFVFKYLDSKGENQVIDISEIVRSFETVTTIVPLQDNGVNTGQYIYTNEANSKVTIDVVGDVINNFDEIIENKEVQETLNQYFNNALPLGNVTYVEENGVFVFKYLDSKGENQVIDISEIVRSFETVTT
ncbi:hypothetical protein HX049_15980, partial [Myroides odoratimimus]|nr:hypothetical protein [Myroides odoratimimus]